MARPKLPPGEKRINVSFTLKGVDHQDLLEIIPAGNRSEWLASVVTRAIRREVKKLG